jgi:DNA-binding transcriptional MocR family regulator
VRKLQRLISSISRRRPELIATYSFPPGDQALRRQIAFYVRDWGVNVKPDEIVITNGCIEALNLCLRAVAKSGDVIALESPTYFGLLEVIESLGMKALEIPSHPRDGISVEALEGAIERSRVSACILMPTVSNPLGSTMSDGAKKHLLEMLGKHRVPIIEDAIYNALHFDSAQPYAAKAYDTDGNVMLCSSFSKTFAPGFRVGWAIPGRYRDRVLSLKFSTSMGVSELLQAVAAEFLVGGSHHRLLRKLRRAYATQLKQYTEAVTHSFPKATKISRPTGGYVLWIVMPESVNSIDLYEEALKRGIGITPGEMFSATGRYRNCIRLNCGIPWSNKVALAIQQLGHLATKLTGQPRRASN